jgi:hypothetical protein
MTHQQEDQAPLNNNAYGTYDSENDDYDNHNDHNDMDMSSSTVSFGEPNQNEIALQIAVLLAIHLAMDSDIQDDGDDDYDFVDDYEDLFMPNVVESFDEPDLDEVAWQTALLLLSSDHGQPR